MTNIVTEAMMEAALDAYREGVYLTDEQVFTSVSRIVEAATLSRPAQEPVAYRAVDPDGDGHIYFDRENTLDVYRKAGVQFTPLYAAPQPVINPTHSQGAGTPGLLTDPAPADHVPCPCTLIEQDEDCTLGYPSMICGVCKGKGHTTQDQVTALACEMIKIASDVGGPEDPFAAWETIDLIQSQNNQFKKLVEEALQAMRQCAHDGGFDREIGPIGCNLGDKCVCLGVYPIIGRANQMEGR